ncbi:MAG: ATP-binding protein [Pseudomonadota bacterium]
MERFRFTPYLLFSLAGAAVAAALLLVTLWLVQLEEDKVREERRAQAVSQLSTVRARLEGIVNSTLYLTRGLVAHIAARGDIGNAEFDDLARELMSHSRHIRNIGLARGNVISHMYPLQGNEGALGLRYLDTPAQRPAVLRAMESRRTVLAGPVDLVQGGRGFINRTPIYLTPPQGQSGSGAYWGMASIVIDADSLLRDAGLQDDSWLVFALRGKDGLGASGEVFLGDAALFERDPVVLEILLPEGYWQLAAIPHDGWEPPLAYVPVMLLGGLLVAALLGMLVYTLLRDRYRLRLARDEAERANRAKSTFLATMSHEIRTPLNGILGMASLLSHSRLDEQQQEFVEAIASSGRVLSNLLGDVLDLSRIEAGKLELEAGDFDLQRLVDGLFVLLAPQAAAKQLQFVTEMDDDVPQHVHGDANRLHQVLHNLLNNAIKFTPAGRVVLAVRCLAVEGAQFWLECTVSDTGIGIAPEMQHRLFRAFEQADSSITRRFGGSGLGLAICKHLVEAMGGSITLDSQPGQGSSFRVLLPLRLGTDERAPAVAADSTHLHVLLAEDQEINRKVAAGLLQQQGCRVTFAANGQEALTALQGDEFDVVLMDVQMPEMDGIEAARRIRQLPDQRKAQIPIVALTAHVMREDVERFLAAGMDAIVEKPLDMEKLNMELARLVTRRQ